MPAAAPDLAGRGRGRGGELRVAARGGSGAGATSRAGVLAALLIAAAAPRAAAEPPRRRLEAVQLGAAYHEHRVLGDDAFGASPTLTLETGAFLAAEVGVSVLVRGQRYVSRAPELGDSTRRNEVLAGVRAYFQPPPDRLLVAFGAGLLVTREPEAFGGGSGRAIQKFVEVYAGWALLRSRCTALELGAHAGYSPDEQYIWAGLALGVRRSAW